MRIRNYMNLKEFIFLLQLLIPSFLMTIDLTILFSKNWDYRLYKMS